MNFVFMLVLVILCYGVGATELIEKPQEEARGKGAKYALLTHLAIAFAAKVGLYKIILGIAFVVASVKIMLIMAWGLAVFRLVPDFWTKHQTLGPQQAGYHNQNGVYDVLIDMFKSQY